MQSWMKFASSPENFMVMSPFATINLLSLLRVQAILHGDGCPEDRNCIAEFSTRYPHRAARAGWLPDSDSVIHRQKFHRPYRQRRKIGAGFTAESGVGIGG